MPRADVVSSLEHTILRPDLLPRDAHKAVADAMELGVAGVVVAPVWLARVVTMMRENPLPVTAAIGFPHGTSKSTIKAIEATSAIKDGAAGLWVVPFLPNLLRSDVEAAKFELMEITRAARATNPRVRIDVVIESGLLRRADPESVESTLAAACRAVRESGCDGIVSGGGFLDSSPVDAAMVELLRRHCDGLTVTANAVRSADEAVAQLDAGADRVASECAGEIARELMR